MNTPGKPAGYTGVWDPSIYLRFAAYRARAAEDLMARITLTVAGDIYDLGCGPGNLTEQLKDHWPERRVIGLDSSPEMLASARKRDGCSRIEWRDGDIATWRAEAPAALIFTNAALHWLPDHATLIPRLMGELAPGGVLAIQVPMTATSKYQTCIRAVKASPRWKARLATAEPHDDPHPAAVYYDWLAPLAADVDLWESEYRHVLVGEHPVTAWIHGTGLVPILSVLDDSEKEAFIADYNAAADAAYPRQVDGSVLLDMHRLFIVAKRRG